MVLEKHIKYKEKYGESEIFWGLGIELETYFQFTKLIHVAAPILYTSHSPERYSVNYYKTFKSGYEKDIQKLFPDPRSFYDLPHFINGHTLSKIDLSGNHDKTYEKDPKPNPIFTKSFFTQLQEFHPALFKDKYEKIFTFDGDTVEFMTQEFYKAKAVPIIQELIQYKKQFLVELNRFLVHKRLFLEKGGLIYPPRNPGFAVFHSNPANIVMFNSGTYHINITLPTLLGPKTGPDPPQIIYPLLFREQHRNCIRFYQWIEPLLIAAYGTADPLSAVSSRYTCASQRCAVSRYIGIGTYDTDAMKEGKLLTFNVNTVRGSNLPYWWYSQYHKDSAYEPLKEIGMDINYKKHYNHGIELRFFDWFPEEKLQGLLELLIYVADASLSRCEAPEPVACESWNNLVVGILRKGREFVLTGDMLAAYEKVFGIEFLNEKKATAAQILQKLEVEMRKQYRGGGLAKFML
jgi:hypothetical protein